MKAEATAASAEAQVRYGDEVIRFQVRHQVGRTTQRVAIHVEPDGRVLVDAPAGASAAAVRAAVGKRAAWISMQVAEARLRHRHLLPREYVSGEALLYQGRRYRLQVLVDPEQEPRAALRGACIVVTVCDRRADLVRDTLAAWYRLRARAVFAERLAAIAPTLRWVKGMPAVRLVTMRRQWGSCSPAGRLTLNPALVCAPRDCIDYVLLHELAHLLHHNHGPAFYKTLKRHMPDWPSLKRRLDGMAEDILRV